MIKIVLSPAKDMDFASPPHTYEHSTPWNNKALFPSAQIDQKRLIDLCRKLTPAELSQMMDISESLAKLNFERFSQFQFDCPTADPKKTEPWRRALFAFNGDAYLAMNPPTLAPKQLAYLDEHLWILSGLYGLLAPSTPVRAYRLEMGRRVPGLPEKSLPKYWSPKISAYVKEHLADGPLVNLASEEYFSLIEETLKSSQQAPQVYQFRFLSKTSKGELKNVSFAAKRGRGLMVRHLSLSAPKTINKLESALSNFSLDGWALEEIHIHTWTYIKA